MARYTIYPGRKLTSAEKSARYYAAHPERKRASVRRWAEANRDQKNAGNRAWNAANKERKRATHLLDRYGLTPVEYDALVVLQGGGCAICSRPHMARSHDGKPTVLHVDHDHDTGQVRGLLCANCNSRIGWLERNRDVIQEYLERDE